MCATWKILFTVHVSNVRHLAKFLHALLGATLSHAMSTYWPFER